MEASRTIQVMVPPVQQFQPQYQQESYSHGAPLQSGRPKTFSVDRALQFTPLTTSILPAHDRLPIPQITRAKESARLTSSAERKSVQQCLSQYSAAKVKERLQGLLKPEMLPEYKFKQFPSVEQGAQARLKSGEQPDFTLTSTAKMIFDSTAVDYKYRSQQQPIKQGQPIPRSQFDQKGSKSNVLKTAPKVQRLDDRVLPGPNGQMPSISKPSARPISINLPKPPPEPKPDTYESNLSSPKRRKLSHDEPTVQVSLHVRSQKDAAEAALQQFQNILLEVFEAQDQLDAGSTAVYEAGFFDQAENGDDSEPHLTTKTMEKLLIGLKKLVNMKKLSDVSSEHLRRLQLLCEPLIDKVQTADLRLRTDADLDEQYQWRMNIRKADTGLLSASLFLHTILTPFPHESLLSTEAIAWIPSALRNIYENCLIPAIESRPDEASSESFTNYVACRDDLKRLLETSRKVLDLVSTACSQTRGLENVVNPIEFLAAKMIFVQNATVDKHSALGIQTFEKVRKTAMSSLARIFARFPAERSAILDEVLSSLDKLPSNSRSARQYRLGDGKNIQLISALFMQLVQNTALEIPESQSRTKRSTATRKLEGLNNDDDDDETDNMQLVHDQGDSDSGDIYTRLQIKGNKLFDGAARSAQEIAGYLVGRASKTTKSGDSPYRNVLDLFIEDMITVLSIPEWPSSELMLRIMAAKMIEMAQTEKTASAKNMALECLGTMGSAISTLKASLPRQCSSMVREGRPKSAVAEHLCKLAADQEHGGVSNEDMIAFMGPFAVASKHLWTEVDHGLRNLSACGFFLAQYAKVVTLMLDPKTFDESDIEAEAVRVANFLLDCITQIGTGSTELQNFDSVSADEAELAYTLSVLNMGFCRRFSVIVKTLSSSFSSDQALVRSRSLKSVVTMLETDSTLLDHDPSIADDVFRCASDDSAIVRDSALSLIARFIIAKPRLEQKGIQRLLECASDAKVGVQKRAIGHLKDVYMKDSRVLLKATISRVILKRTVDHEDTVSELAKKTLSEMWIAPALAQLVHSADLAKTKVAIEDLTGDIVSCVAYDSATLCPLLKRFIKTILTSDAKPAKSTRELCGKIVDVLFENAISSQDEKGPLMVLTSFAEADPELIPPTSLGKLQPYLGNLKTENDLFVFKAVISIFGCVLPHLSATHKPLLLDIQNALMKAISSLGRRAELDTVMSCLQVIDSVVQNTMRLIKLAGSIVLKIKIGTGALTKSQDGVPQLLKLLRIAGSMARYIDLEKYWRQFGQEVKEEKELKGRSVAAYFAATFLPLTQKKQPHKVRLLALESLGSVCQAFPGQLNQKSIQEAFFSTFTSDGRLEDTADRDSLQGVVLKVFDELYAHRAQSKEDDENGGDDQEEKQELGKLGGDSKTRDGDSAISLVTGTVAKSALAVALSSPSDNALIATKTLSSISHQGLTHPKQSLLAFVALSTCPDTRIADVAHSAHRLLHQQHESVCEREYMTAVHEAFEYQRNVLSDSCGARQPTYKAKLALCFEVVNSSGSKYVKKFLSGLVSRVSAKISSQETTFPADQVLWTLFAVQNLAFFEFAKLDEVLHAILQLELAYSKKGVEISQILEAALTLDTLPDAQSAMLMDEDIQINQDIVIPQSIKDIATVRRLAPLAGTLTIMMEGRSYLKRQYGVGRDVRAAISNTKQAKDTGKAPTKVHGITGEKFWTKSNAVIELLHNDSGMISCCQNFVSLMSMDDEINVNDDDPFREQSGSIGPTEMQDYVRSNTPGGVKRKLSASASGTPAKRGPGRPLKNARRSTSVSSADDLDADFAG